MVRQRIAKNVAGPVRWIRAASVPLVDHLRDWTVVGFVDADEASARKAAASQNPQHAHEDLSSPLDHETSLPV
jgi:hypothetical protein